MNEAWMDEVINNEIDIMLDKQQKCFAYKGMLETLKNLDLLDLRHLSFNRKDIDNHNYYVQAYYHFDGDMKTWEFNT